jgi:hypothetical protein
MAWILAKRLCEALWLRMFLSKQGGIQEGEDNFGFLMQVKET